MAKTKKAFLIFIDKIRIDDVTLNSVEVWVKEHEADQLFLIIESPGGSPFSAVAIMNILHKKFPKITTIVPRSAKSAATLMSLGTDDIYMNERSALGPLDLPIEHPRDGSRISALDVRNTTTSIADLVGSIAKFRYEFLRERDISTLDAVKIALENATQFLKPIMEQVDPYHLQKAERELRIGFRYALNMLRARMMKGDAPKAEETAKELVNSYPAHEYSIFFDEAVELGLTVKKLAELPEWKNVLQAKYDKVRHKKYHVEYGIMEENDTITKEKKSKA